MSVFESQNAVILSFLPFSGGKFLSNCLSLSRHACPQSPIAAEYLLQFPDDYDYRIKTILHTLPNQKQMQEWRAFEFGDRYLYGEAFDSWILGQSHQANQLTEKLCRSHMKFFLTDHSMSAMALSRVWKNATIIKLTNSRKFQDLCLSIKLENPNTDISKYNGNYCKEKYTLLRDADWPTWRQFEKSGYDVRNFPTLDTGAAKKIAEFYYLHSAKNQVLLFDVHSYFDIDRFMRAVKQLYRSLNFTDFQPDLVAYFYQQYIDLHFSKGNNSGQTL